MEVELSKHLFDLAEAFGAARQLNESTVGKMCASDGRFFARLRDGKTFTVKKYDELLVWFSVNWPEGKEWPTMVERPEPKPVAEAAE